MGCHTWFYKPLEKVIEYDIIREVVMKELKESIDLNQRWVDDPNDPEYLEMVAIYTDWTPEYINHCLSIYKRQYQMVKKGLCREAVVRKYCTYKDYEYIPGKGFFIDADFHDLFRYHVYDSEIRLFSMEETVAFISNVNNNCTITDRTERRLKEFWSKYPNGFIEFG